MTDRADPFGYFGNWEAVKSGVSAAAAEPSDFMFFLNDMHPDLFEKLFRDLPHGDQFISRLNRLVDDHLDRAALDPSLAGRGYNQLTIRRHPKNRLNADELLAVAKRDVVQRSRVLRHCGLHDEAEKWNVDSFAFSDDAALLQQPDPKGPNVWLVDDILRFESLTFDASWLFILTESAYHLVGNSYALHPWLFRQWAELPVDLEPSYELWRAGGRYQFSKGVCFVYEHV